LKIGLLSGSLFEQLPAAQLTSLSVRFAAGDIVISLAQFKALKSLRMSALGCVIHIDGPLPAQLEYLTTNSSQVVDNATKNFIDLPAGLKRFHGIAQHGLTMMSLPRTLTNLQFTYSSVSGPLDHSSIESIPQGLIRLSLPAELTIDPASLIHLPTTLKHLECALAGRFRRLGNTVIQGSPTEAALELESTPTLPTSLTSFVLLNTYENVLPAFSPCLKTLDWHIWNVEPTKWPKTLETMTVTLFDRFTVWTDAKRITSSEEMLKHRMNNEPWLPEGLQSLSMNPKSPTQLFLILPHRLTHLHINCGTTLAPISASKQELSFFMEEGEEEQYDADEEMEEETDVFEKMFPPGWVRLLPTTLTSLELNIPTKNIDNQWVDDLPCTALRSLRFCSGVRFHSSQIDHLPPLLTTLALVLRNDLDWSSFNLHQRHSLRNLNLKTQSKHIHFPSDGPLLLRSLPPKLHIVQLLESPLTPLHRETLTAAHIWIGLV
jgi:hypothetical protein